MGPAIAQNVAFGGNSENLSFGETGSTITINLTNSASMYNRGVELMLQGKIIKNKDWEWDAALNFSYNHSKVTERTYDITPRSAIYGSTIIVGRPYAQLTSIRYGGLDDNGEPTFLKADRKSVV